MTIRIRQEKENDYNFAEKVIEEAFKNEEHTDHREHFLVAKLRKSDAFIPELSLVAELDGEIIGHILLTKIIVKNNKTIHNSLALAPVSVLPVFQNQGIGSRLVTESLKFAKDMGYESAVVLGHDKYYPRFGFKPASTWGIKAPFEIADELFMAVEMTAGALNDVSGNVVYSKEFTA